MAMPQQGEGGRQRSSHLFAARAHQPMPAICVAVPQVIRDRHSRRTEQSVRAVRAVPHLLVMRKS